MAYFKENAGTLYIVLYQKDPKGLGPSKYVINGSSDTVITNGVTLAPGFGTE